MISDTIRTTPEERRSVKLAQHRGRLMQLLLGKFQQEPESVPVAGDGLRTGIALSQETVGEEGLEQRGEVRLGLHADAPPF